MKAPFKDPVTRVVRSLRREYSKRYGLKYTVIGMALYMERGLVTITIYNLIKNALLSQELPKGAIGRI